MCGLKVIRVDHSNECQACLAMRSEIGFLRSMVEGLMKAQSPVKIEQSPPSPAYIVRADGSVEYQEIDKVEPRKSIFQDVSDNETDA